MMRSLILVSVQFTGNKYCFSRNINLSESKQFNFLSNIPEEIRSILKGKNPYPSLSSPLIAQTENENLFFKENVFAAGVQFPSGFVNEDAITPGNMALETRFFTRSAKISALEIGTNIISTGRIDPNPIHSTEVAINQHNAFKVANIHVGIPKITIDEFGHQKIRSTEFDIAKVDVAQARAAQVNGLEVNAAQVTTMQNDTSKVSLPICITPEQFSCGNNSGVTIFNTAIRHNGITKNSPFVDLNISQVGISQVCTAQVSTAQVGIAQVGTSQISTIQISTSEIGIAQVGVNKKSIGKVRFFQISTPQVSIHQTTALDVNSAQIDVAQVDTNQPRWSDKESSQINSPKISFPCSISLQQLLSSYSHLYTSALIDTYKDNHCYRTNC